MMCPVCSRERLAPGRSVGPGCVATLRGLLDGLPVLMESINAAAGGRLRFGAKISSAQSRETPVPVNLRASRAGQAARLAVVGWARKVARARQEPMPTSWAEIGRFLDVRATWLAGQADGPEAFEDLIGALSGALRAVDRPADRHYAGPCVTAGCAGELYALAGRAAVACPRCGAEYGVADRRAWLLSEAWGMVATGPDIARALAGEAFGLEVNLSTLRRWASEGKLERVDTVRGRPRYRVGDVVDLLTAGRDTPGVRSG